MSRGDGQFWGVPKLHDEVELQLHLPLPIPHILDRVPSGCFKVEPWRECPAGASHEDDTDLVVVVQCGDGF